MLYSQNFMARVSFSTVSERVVVLLLETSFLEPLRPEMQPEGEDGEAGKLINKNSYTLRACRRPSLVSPSIFAPPAKSRDARL